MSLGYIMDRPSVGSREFTVVSSQLSTVKLSSRRLHCVTTFRLGRDSTLLPKVMLVFRGLNLVDLLLDPSPTSNYTTFSSSTVSSDRVSVFMIE